jgi:hypothetical protein
METYLKHELPEGGGNTVGTLRAYLNWLVHEYPNYNDLRVWQGTDSGEGYLSITNILVVNARHVPTDADEQYGEVIHVEGTQWQLGSEYTCVRPQPSGDVIGYQDILVLGGHATVQEIEANIAAEIARDKYEASKKEQKEKEAALEADPDYHLIEAAINVIAEQSRQLRAKYGL